MDSTQMSKSYRLDISEDKEDSTCVLGGKVAWAGQYADLPTALFWCKLFYILLPRRVRGPDLSADMLRPHTAIYLMQIGV